MGAYLHGARWSSKGRRVIYAAETYAGAVLETLVHANIGLTSSRDAWIEITVPSSVPIETIQSDEIPGWDAANLRASRAYGDRWYQERRTAVLLVPSLVTRGIERNVLLNQEHPGFAGISATDPRHVHWDALLFTH
jgi:RES domain-containing protein